MGGMGFGNLITVDILKNKRLSAKVDADAVKAQDSTTTETLQVSPETAKAPVGLRKVPPKVNKLFLQLKEN
jgi:hypothetical protein